MACPVLSQRHYYEELVFSPILNSDTCCQKTDPGLILPFLPLFGLHHFLLHPSLPCPPLPFATGSRSTFEISPAGRGGALSYVTGTTLIKHWSQILGPHSHSCWKGGPEGPCWMVGKLAGAADAVWIWRAGDVRGSEPSACVGGTPLALALRGRSVKPVGPAFPLQQLWPISPIDLLIISK